MRTLIVADVEAILTQLSRTIGNAGHQLTITDTTTAAVAELTKRVFDLLIVDILLPGIETNEFLEAIRSGRKNNQMAAIVLTTLADEQYMVEVLESWADDYIKMPIGDQELLARVRVRSRQCHTDDLNEIVVGDLIIHVDKYRVESNGRVVSLTHPQLLLLTLLAKNAGKVLEAATLLDRLNNGQEASRGKLRRHIRQLRATLENIRSTVSIETEIDIGYKLVDPSQH